MGLHFSVEERAAEKMQPGSADSGPTGCRGIKPRQQDQEDCMTNLAIYLLSASDIPGFGRWMFLSISVVALFVVFIPLTSWIDSQRKEREAFYKAETVRRLAEAPGEGAKAAIELLREQDRMERTKKLEGIKIGGLINIGVGLALLIFLQQLVRDEPVYLCGLIPGLIGVALLVYAFFLAPKAQ
jgi:hypothetical protein